MKNHIISFTTNENSKAKKTNSLGNQRPLSIPDLYTSIFEKLVLMEIRKDHEDHREQFGFKPNASCAHATFVLKEICR
jgi:hypothetical protein